MCFGGLALACAGLHNTSRRPADDPTHPGGPAFGDAAWTTALRSDFYQFASCAGNRIPNSAGAPPRPPILGWRLTWGPLRIYARGPGRGRGLGAEGGAAPRARGPDPPRARPQKSCLLPRERCSPSPPSPGAVIPCGGPGFGG